MPKELDRKAHASFESGLYCAESVLKTIAEDRGIHSPLIPRIATGLCSGMSRTCGTCGALTGATLAINLVLGRDSADQTVEENYAAVQELVERFKAEFGSTGCAELLDCDLGTEEGQAKYNSEDLGQRCARHTAEAARIVGDILDRK